MRILLAATLLWSSSASAAQTRAPLLAPAAARLGVPAAPVAPLTVGAPLSAPFPALSAPLSSASTPAAPAAAPVAASAAAADAPKPDAPSASAAEAAESAGAASAAA